MPAGVPHRQGPALTVGREIASLSKFRAKLLVVDDNPANRDVLSRRLGRFGDFRIEEAADGVEALAAIGVAAGAGEFFDLVLLDVMMPRMNGIEVLTALMEGPTDHRPAVIMISAATEIDTVVRCIELGAEDYLPKPFNPTLLRARIGSVLDRRHLSNQLTLQLRRLEVEMADARRQQLSMVPNSFPTLGPDCPAEAHGLMVPAREVGGDLYDCFEAAPGVLCVAVGDVSDKGMPAALFMARTRSLLRAAALQHVAITGAPPLPSGLAEVLNEELCKNNPGAMFVTLFVGFLFLDEGRLAFVNAGHPRPVHLPAEGAILELRTEPELPLGVMEGLRHTDHECRLARGDTVVVFTDGLADMRDEDGGFYSEERVLADLEELRAAPPAALCRELAARVRGFAGAAPPADDITVLALRWN
jgi:serine phosphatase RsbU (regulator of sigma subunit)